ncbi:hypothetical protein AAIG88_32710, partial [Pseudomonas aeruginosa]
LRTPDIHSTARLHLRTWRVFQHLADALRLLIFNHLFSNSGAGIWCFDPGFRSQRADIYIVRFETGTGGRIGGVGGGGR